MATQDPYNLNTAGTAQQPPPWIQNDYWAPDRQQVLADPSRWGPGPNAQPAPSPAPAANTYDRNTFRDAVLSGVHNTTDLANLVNNNQSGFAQGVKILPGKGDKIVLPDGAVLDAVQNAGINGGTNGAWTGVGDMGANGQITPYANGAAGTGASGSSAFGSFGSGGNDAISQAFRMALLTSMQNSQKPYDPNAPQNLSQQTAYNTQRDRAATQERAALAERAAANGLNSGGAGSGAFESGIEGILENKGQDEASFAGGLAQQDYQAKRQDLQNALGLANSIGARDQAAALQLQLANLDNQYRYAALGQQGQQFNDTLGYNYANLQATLNRQSILDALGVVGG